MKNQRKRARHSVSLVLALVGLVSVSALLMAPSRHASAQASASWSYTGSLITGRWDHTATLLQDGRVLVAGGYSECCPPTSFAGFLKSAELYDPSTGTWSSTGSLNIDHRNHTATLLPNGKVLVVGGGGNTPVAGLIAELYDPNTGTWSLTGNLNTRRSGHTATLLPNGKVLVVGGFFAGSALNTAELYDPSTGTWSYTGNLSLNPGTHSATLLPNGKVLVAGGSTCSDPDGEDCVPNSPQLYDPTAGTWSLVGGVNFGSETARLLLNGKVLFVWSSELYDPTTGAWSITGSPNRSHSTATLLFNGKVLLAGDYFDASGIAPTATELYDPATGTWSVTANLNKGRNSPTATRLLNGRVLVVGGYNYVSSPPGFLRDTLNSAELYDPGTNEVSSPTPTPTPTSTPTATPTPTPTPTPIATPTSAVPTWTVTGTLNTGRDSQTATLLPNGKVLVVGGNDNNGTLKSAELYDPTTGTWTNTSSLNTSSAFHTATLLPNGKVLVAGGFTCGPPPQTCASLNGAELYDPSTGAWTNTGTLNAARDGHAAILLQSGKVLVIGGDSVGNGAELYDPATGTWSLTGNLSLGRRVFTATLLKNGKVIVAGGSDDNRTNATSSAELYDPATGIWSSTGNLITARGDHTANLLPNGKVLVAGGFVDYESGAVTNSAELYDPTTGVWTNTGNLTRGRTVHTATVLMTGKVLVAGGFFIDGLPNITDSCELYDPATGTWSNTTSLHIGRRFHTATLLLNGKVLAAGGSGFPNSAELYDPGAGLNPIDDATFFITQQYLDFLHREPEPSCPPGQCGLDFYLPILNGCGTDAECFKYTRGALSANFFRSPEFQQKGSYVANLYNITLGQRPKTVAELNDATKVERPHYAEFITDLATLSVPTDAETNARKDQLAIDWLNRPEIQQILPGTLTNQQFVLKVETIAGVTLADESTLIANLNNGTQTRAQVLRVIAENPEIISKFYIQNFVTMEYFGYLRRDPEDCHASLDPSNCGYIFHNSRFNTPGANPDLIENIIVRGFIESPEYRGRFGP